MKGLNLLRKTSKSRLDFLGRRDLSISYLPNKSRINGPRMTRFLQSGDEVVAIYFLPYFYGNQARGRKEDAFYIVNAEVRFHRIRAIV
jgi:hypothetical protein